MGRHSHDARGCGKIPAPRTRRRPDRLRLASKTHGAIQRLPQDGVRHGGPGLREGNRAWRRRARADCGLGRKHRPSWASLEPICKRRDARRATDRHRVYPDRHATGRGIHPRRSGSPVYGPHPRRRRDRVDQRDNRRAGRANVVSVLRNGRGIGNLSRCAPSQD